MLLPSRRELCALLGSGTLFGCSLIYDLSPDQCGTSADCDSFGNGYVCVEGMCKAGEDPGGGECTTSGDCLDLDPTPRACIELTQGRASTRTCVPLQTEECPRILPTGGLSGGMELWNDALRAPGSIVVGAFGDLPPEGFSTFTRNYDLVFTELRQVAAGVPGKNGATRPVVVVVCNNNTTEQAPLLEATRHLVDDLRVPAIIAALPSADLQAAFNQTRVSEFNENVLFVSPNASTEGVADLTDDNLVWNILPNGGEVAKAYGPLLTRTIDYLRSSRAVGASEAIKVAVVFSNDRRVLIDMKAALPDILNFNGKDYATNKADGNLEEILVTTSLVDPTAMLTSQIDRILAFAPHVVIELGANELFSKLIPGIEGAVPNTEGPWEMEAPAGQTRPFYFLSPYHYLTSQSLSQAVTDHRMPDPLSVRMAGANFAAAPAEFQYIVDEWHDSYANLWTDAPDTTGYENYYDAPWYVIGSIAATTGTTEDFTGLHLAEGMLRLQSESATDYPVGPTELTTWLDELNRARSIELVGTMGRPTFDATGAREGSGSVWCVTPSSQQLADVLRVDETTDELVGDGFAVCNPDF